MCGSQKIFRDCLLCWNNSTFMGGSLELYELLVELVVQDQDRGDVIATVAVVGR